ncbi:MAG: DUF2807 domain-containing protein [Prolixibacteraceae bacterium]|nr:DUF2807 domain-containing protein [Prolixibacteraceae bacterium]
MKKTVLLFIFFALFLPIITMAQNDKNWDSKDYQTGEFTKIYLEGGFKVVLIQGNDCELTVKTTNVDAFNDLTVRNENGKLNIVLDREFFRYNRVNLYITFSDLEALEIEGGVNLETYGYIDVEDFAMHVEGGAKVELELKADNIEIEGEGGFLFELDGVTENFNVKISGAGHVDADDLKAQNVDFKVEGFGTGNVHAVDQLNAHIEGVGRLRYKGNPKVTQYIDGLGSVKRD